MKHPPLILGYLGRDKVKQVVSSQVHSEVRRLTMYSPVPVDSTFSVMIHMIDNVNYHPSAWHWNW
jgi:hypothetical protein